MNNIMNTAKKKAGTAILCGALVLTLGTGTTFAADSTDSVLMKSEGGVKTYSTDGGQTWREQVSEGVLTFGNKDRKIKIKNASASNDVIGTKVMVKSENGVKLYSTDGGQSWSENAPEGMPTFNPGAGNIKIKNDFESKDGIKTKVMIKSENGVKLYSTDGGQTWSENAPEGMPTFNPGAGNIKIKN
ncbi:glycoside hydrolase, partial [Paenibacillus profundus]